MRRFLIITLLALGSLSLRAQAPGGKEYAVLDSLLTNYVGAIQTSDQKTKEAECDFLITSVEDEEMRSHIATTLFRYYKDAPVMGDEAVAIYLYDKWFASGAMKMEGEFTQMDAEMFVRLNRNSLIGMEAPVITLRKPCRGKQAVPEEGRTTILWFYDTACAKCKLESKVLPGVLEGNVDFPVTLCAVYAGQDKKEWKAFRKSFKVNNELVKVQHLWDPEFDSDYLRLYGVMATPRMYVTAPDGTIIGRRLEVESLVQILPIAKELSKLLVK